ncbi:MAG: hypothetical protein NZM44_05925 [Candidatus Calescibacterium sp.]|nr:hypothetical protein [Candidatus Calescibacterium sp.]
MKNRNSFSIILAILIIILGIYYRLIPHPPNFSPLISITVFSGFVLIKNKYLAYLLPLIILITSDLIIGIHNQIITVYLSFIVSVYLSEFYFKSLKLDTENSNLKKVLHANISGLINSTWFYLFTNFVVWISTNMYSKNLNGLIECYIMAIPFFKNSLISSIIFTTIIFGIYYYFHLMMEKLTIETK